MTDRHICETCHFAKEFCSPPGPGKNEDGVSCTSFAKAREQDANEERQTHGDIHLFRIEAIDDKSECGCWATASI